MIRSYVGVLLQDDPWLCCDFISKHLTYSGVWEELFLQI